MDAQQKERLTSLSKTCGDHCSISVSESYDQLSSTKQQLNLARTSLRLARFEGIDNQMVFIWKYKHLILFLSATQSDASNEISPSVLDPIKEYDKEHSSEYYQTLRAYLLCDMDYTRMAQRLNVHKNTISYRMQRIAEMFELNLRDCRVITTLYLSLFEDLNQGTKEDVKYENN